MSGFAVADPRVVAGGFVHMLVSVTILGLALLLVANRATSFADRARIVLYVTLAASFYMHLGNSIWYHYDWSYTIYRFIPDFVLLAAAGLVIARWFLPPTQPFTPSVQ